jgi:transposase
VLDAVHHQQAEENTIYHALYAHFILGLSVQQVSHLYGKSRATMYRWVKDYVEHGYVTGRKGALQEGVRFKKEHRDWLKDFFLTNPSSYLDEAKAAFEIQCKLSISVSTVWAILHTMGFTRKVYVCFHVAFAAHNTILSHFSL